MNALWRRILELFRPGQLDREAVEELSHHVDLLVERKVSAGVEPIEARRQALAEVGTVASARERIAEERSRVALDQLGREIGYAARVLRRSPAITLLSVATMGWASESAPFSSRWSTPSSCGRCPTRTPIASYASSTPIHKLASSAPAWPSATSTTGGRWPAPSTASSGIT
jgi:hypothetical protein